MRAKAVIPTFDEMYNLLPEEIKSYLDKCNDTPQSPNWHPEGCVLTHIKIVYNRTRKTGDMNQALSAIFHDLGKADVTKLTRKGTWGAYGHEFISARLVEKHKNWINKIGGDWFQVYNIVKEHMRIKQYDVMKHSKQEYMKQNKWFNKIKQFTSFDDMTTLTDDEMNT